jgi:hypothetical protein
VPHARAGGARHGRAEAVGRARSAQCPRSRHPRGKTAEPKRGLRCGDGRRRSRPARSLNCPASIVPPRELGCRRQLCQHRAPPPLAPRRRTNCSRSRDYRRDRSSTGLHVPAVAAGVGTGAFVGGKNVKRARRESPRSLIAGQRVNSQAGRAEQGKRFRRERMCAPVQAADIDWGTSMKLTDHPASSPPPTGIYGHPHHRPSYGSGPRQSTAAARSDNRSDASMCGWTSITSTPSFIVAV